FYGLCCSDVGVLVFMFVFVVFGVFFVDFVFFFFDGGAGFGGALPPADPRLCTPSVEHRPGQADSGVKSRLPM
ncbi:hypothetical protein, partial [Nocardia brasiliensis]|uniref:hypothetical protein n=1 Tax=Nocardia brasiliensis TaxID=37326 RepID=UPI0024553259